MVKWPGLQREKTASVDPIAPSAMNRDCAFQGRSCVVEMNQEVPILACR
jgi:hypothetical protein